MWSFTDIVFPLTMPASRSPDRKPTGLYAGQMHLVKRSHTCNQESAAGYCGELTAAIGLYIAFAELLNETWFRGRIVISLGAMTWPQKLYDRKMSEEREKSQYRRV
ncbi:TPA: hypothetical protein ACH3X3_000221 [Trebouxia sp. C0006]